MKILGMVLLFAACSFAGIISAAQKADTIKYIEALISLVSFIKFKISSCRTELNEIYGEFENEYMKKCGSLQILRDKGFKEALIYSDKRTKLPENEARTLREFAEKLGSSDVQDQLETLDATMMLLSDCRDELKEKYPSQKKLYVSLGMLAGALAVIILF